ERAEHDPQQDHVAQRRDGAGEQAAPRRRRRAVRRRRLLRRICVTARHGLVVGSPRCAVYGKIRRPRGACPGEVAPGSPTSHVPANWLLVRRQGHAQTSPFSYSMPASVWLTTCREVSAVTAATRTICPTTAA